MVNKIVRDERARVARYNPASTIITSFRPSRKIEQRCRIAVAKFYHYHLLLHFIRLIFSDIRQLWEHPVDVAVDSDRASALCVRRMPYYLTQPFCRKSARTCREMYLPQRDDVPLCRDKAVQSGVVSGPREKKERKAMREKRFGRTDGVNSREW